MAILHRKMPLTPRTEVSSVTLYEQELAKLFNVRGAVAVSSGTAAVEVSLIGVSVGPGDEVLIPSVSPVMTALPILRVGATPVFVDNEPYSFSPSTADLSQSITQYTKALIVAPLWGYPIEYDNLVGFTNSHNLVLLEDAAQAYGSTYFNRLIGTIGIAGCFSTNETKLVSTGEGGFILSDDLNFIHRVREYVNYGMVLESSSPQYGQCGYLPGSNFKLSAIQATEGILQLKRLQERIKNHTRNAEYLLSGLANSHIVIPYRGTPNGKPNYYKVVLLVTNSIFYNPLIDELVKTKLFTVAGYTYKPLYEYPLFSVYKRDCPNADVMATSFLVIPLQDLTKEDIDQIVDVVYRVENYSYGGHQKK